MKRLSVAIIASFATLLTTAAIAMPEGECPSKRPPMPTAEIDTDKDGALSADEIKNFHQKRLNEADVNHDGGLDANEFKTMHDQKTIRMHESMFKHMDGDGNGLLSADELGKRYENKLKTCDTDQDGDLSKSELDNCHPKMHRGMHQQPGGPKAGPDNEE